ncbi:hypothetical protein [Chamaesiphon sp. VAR_48_metabat_135_sub]|uniref:hypothetical protein n=1 Tax=Chamaesiphon sp. VAR_48_metabat_135_sub TaxID=2964699 RepID=UPI00286BF81A|nr:hypothetical protein [Chamaesiphon sp. VAR_48_metabat_135_sub]
MMVDAHSHGDSSFAESSQDLYLQHEMEDRSQFLEDLDNTLGMLDDETIIWRFARGKKRLVINQNLRIDYAHNSLQLSTPNGDLIAIHKIAEKLHYILIERDSKYSELIQNIISECQFIPIDTATAERRFMRYQKYEIPEGYTLRYDSAAVLWQTWQEDRQQTGVGLRLDILILARSKWYRIQQMICTDDRLDLQTRLGLISLSLRDRIAWIAKLGDLPSMDDVDLTNQKNAINGGTDSDILGKIISKLAIETSPNSDLHFNFHTTMSKSVFSESNNSSLLYDDDRSSTLTGHHLPQISEQLRTSAIDVLEDYLEHGETIVRTETMLDDRGNVISEKTVSTHRGCPRWAIEAIINWS